MWHDRYEANLFGLVQLMSTVMIFNSMFPVDASTVRTLNRFGQQARCPRPHTVHHTITPPTQRARLPLGAPL